MEMLSEQDKNESPPQGEVWDFKEIFGCLIAGVFLQWSTLPCFCEVGTVKLQMAMAVDGVILCRIGIAWVRQEVSQTWKFYGGLCITSPAW
ncbi:MAG: hypothetical protein AAF492_03315, partial [Verrucomicrobiota bacterium]